MSALLERAKSRSLISRAKTRLAISVAAFVVFLVTFMSQLGGGANTGGVFPEPLLILGLLGMPVAAVFVVVSAVQLFLRWSEFQRNDKKAE